jgi:hypothetical protein
LEVGAAKHRVLEVGVEEHRALEVGAAKHRALEVGVVERRTPEVDPAAPTARPNSTGSPAPSTPVMGATTLMRPMASPW